MGFWIVAFANLSALIRPRGVEIAEAGKSQTIGVIVSLERIFKKELGAEYLPRSEFSPARRIPRRSTRR
jgi:hypothetical protein